MAYTGVIHNGVATGRLPSAVLYAQIPLRGGGLAVFGGKQLQFDPRHFRLFAHRADAICFEHGICLSVPLVPGSELQGMLDGLTAIRYPLDQELRTVVAGLAVRHRTAKLPIVVASDAGLQRLVERLPLFIRAMRQRIDQLPGRSAHKRVDNYLRLERARDYLESAFADDPGTDRLAEEAAISRAHFIRLFGTFYGLSPKQYVLELKLERARKLLSTSALTIWEVAEASGFGNRCAFQRMFRQRVGMTPGCYREQGEPTLARGDCSEVADPRAARISLEGTP